MSIHIESSKENIDWEKVAQILREAKLTDISADLQKKAFLNSYAVTFVYDDDQLIGVGRALSDGVSQAAIYNIALEEAYRGKGIGRALLNHLIAQVKDFNIILYTHPSTVALYEKFGFRKMKTGMAIYKEEKLPFMEAEGFI